MVILVSSGHPLQESGPHDYKYPQPLHPWVLERGHTLKETSILSHVDANFVKAIEKARLLALYTGGRGHLLKPEKQAKHIAVDEFKIHCGHIYATIVIDLSDGSVIYLAHGKKKQALEDFLALVGDDWMNAVDDVASDMNSNYELVFLERYPKISIVSICSTSTKTSRTWSSVKCARTSRGS